MPCRTAKGADKRREYEAAVAKAAEAAGKAVGNRRLEAQGDCDQIEGNVQKKVGEIKKVFGK